MNNSVEEEPPYPQRWETFCLSDGPPPYEEVVAREMDQDPGVSGTEESLYPFRDLKRISNRGLLRNLRLASKIQKSTMEQNSSLRGENQSTYLCEDSDCIVPLNPKILIGELSQDSEGRVALNSVAEKLNESESTLSQVIESYPLIFSAFEEYPSGNIFVELNPQFEFCQKYLGKGCINDCHMIHICSQYLKGMCDAGFECLYGHEVMTDHNREVLISYSLEDIDVYHLYMIFCKKYRQASPPRICHMYNQGSCSYDMHCFDLHICQEYSKSFGNCPAGGLCMLNHDIYEPQCTKIFDQVGIVTSRSKESDILKMIVVNSQKPDENMGSASKICTKLLERNFTDFQLDDFNKKKAIETDSDSECSKSSPLSSSPSQGEDVQENSDKVNVNPCSEYQEAAPQYRQPTPAVGLGVTIRWSKSGHRRRGSRGRDSRSSHVEVQHHDHTYNEQRQSRYHHRKEVRRQKKIEKMERKVRRIQSKIDYMKGTSAPQDNPSDQ